jgi:purine-binding chemotaxis protein CheW
MGRHVIIVVQVGSQFVGLLVDAVSDILSVSESEVLPPPDVASEMAKRFVCGLLAMEGRMLSILSVDSVLPEQERSDPQ